jgi:hypothetical protein
MSNVVGIRSAEAQCAEYIEKQRQQRYRRAADQAFAAHLDKMAGQYGALVTLGAVMRYVGLLLVEAADRDAIRLCRGYLARKIVQSATRRLLTGWRMLH